MAQIYDLAIIGGGVNGCGIARDAAGRGASVYLCEMDDLASGTSSASTKLIHGGLRYLEYYEFKLVREALKEREVLWRLAPHIIWPLRFVLPYHKGLRPVWLLRLGLFLYDHIGGRKLLPGTRRVDLTRDTVGQPLQKGLFRTGFEYSDCWVDDARLVALNAHDAAQRGAVIQTRTRAVSAHAADDHWQIVLDTKGTRTSIRARALVNAAGPWVDRASAVISAPSRSDHVRLVRGSHIVVPKLFDHDRCYIFQNTDGRVVFAIPYEDDFTLIGTTDSDFVGDPAEVTAPSDEIDYLCTTINDYLEASIKPEDVVWSYAGVRPLFDNGSDAAQAATRDYVLDLTVDGCPPLLTIFGGKITTYRRLAEQAVDRLAPFLPAKARAGSGWTADAPLPGGDMGISGLAALEEEVAAHYPWLAATDRRRLLRSYGTRVREVLDGANDYGSLGECFGAGLHAAEVRYLMNTEWAQTAADVLWRRSKLGLRLSADEVDRLETFMRQELCG